LSTSRRSCSLLGGHERPTLPAGLVRVPGDRQPDLLYRSPRDVLAHLDAEHAGDDPCIGRLARGVPPPPRLLDEILDEVAVVVAARSLSRTGGVQRRTDHPGVVRIASTAPLPADQARRRRTSGGLPQLDWVVRLGHRITAAASERTRRASRTRCSWSSHRLPEGVVREQPQAPGAVRVQRDRDVERVIRGVVAEPHALLAAVEAADGGQHERGRAPMMSRAKAPLSLLSNPVIRSSPSPGSPSASTSVAAHSPHILATAMTPTAVPTAQVVGVDDIDRTQTSHGPSGRAQGASGPDARRQSMHQLRSDPTPHHWSASCPHPPS
jgi:hypothetical protein